MKRIGTTDQGGVILEMTSEELNRFQQACDALADMLVAGANHGIQVNPVEISQPETPPQPGKGSRTVTAKRGATKTARKPAEKTADAGAFPSRMCVVCGKSFVPKRATSNTCSKACLDKSYRLAKKRGVERTAVKPEPTVKSSPTMAATGTKVCADCKRTYKPTSNAQVRCEDCGKKHRLNVIRNLHNKGHVARPLAIERSGSAPNLDDVPEFQRAQREAGEDN